MQLLSVSDVNREHLTDFTATICKLLVFVSVCAVLGQNYYDNRNGVDGFTKLVFSADVGLNNVP